MTKVHITQHSGKLYLIRSINTSVKLNPYCVARQNIVGSICDKCYADTYATLRPTLREALERNTELLTQHILTDAEIPVLNDRYFRFESFGDLQNETQLTNYFNIARANAKTTFALWTKNPFIVKRTLRTQSKPDNIIIIYSSPMINRKVSDSIFKAYPFIDKVFTVYDKAHATGINCGKRKCIECKLCYTKNSATHINELLK